MRIRISCAVFSLWLGSFAGAQPTTAPSVIAADQSTPRGAIKMLTIAMNKGDAATIKQVFSTTNTTEAKMLDAVAEQKAAQAKFRDAVVASFSAEDARKLVGDYQVAEAQGLMSLDSASEKIDGDSATVSIEDQKLTLKKQDAKWTVPVPAVEPAQADQQLAAIQREAKIYKSIADDITNGRFKSADEAGKALQLKALQQMMTHEPGTTQPATAPAQSPGTQ